MSDEDRAKKQANDDLQYSKKFGFQPLHFTIENSNADLVQVKDERYKPGTILDNSEMLDVRTTSEIEDF